VFLGILYASVTARFVFFNVFKGTKHVGNHTVVGWAAWAGILGVTWVLAFIIAEVNQSASTWLCDVLLTILGYTILL
jgi:hypothetical protein